MDYFLHLESTYNKHTSWAGVHLQELDVVICNLKDNSNSGNRSYLDILEYNAHFIVYHYHQHFEKLSKIELNNLGRWGELKDLKFKKSDKILKDYNLHCEKSQILNIWKSTKIELITEALKNYIHHKKENIDLFFEFSSTPEVDSDLIKRLTRFSEKDIPECVDFPTKGNFTLCNLCYGIHQSSE